MPAMIMDSTCRKVAEATVLYAGGVRNFNPGGSGKEDPEKIELQKDWCSPENPDIKLYEPLEGFDAGTPHDGQEGAQYGAAQYGDGGQTQGSRQSLYVYIAVSIPHFDDRCPHIGSHLSFIFFIMCIPAGSRMS